MKPILFNTEMVRAILEGRKTVTRRVVKPQPREIYHGGTLYEDGGNLIALVEAMNGHLEQVVSPYITGDILYVRETWARYHEHFLFKTNCPDTDFMLGQRGVSSIRWHPSIHMPREAARIFLRVTDVRVERLQGITEEQVVKEGIYRTQENYGIGIYDFQDLWNSTIKHADRALYGWEADPWVWVIDFERIDREEAEQCL